ncbi:MAG: hypothetical protein IPL71_04575 [Anaerolineales bacterium]|uniref:hypothetical protein n=1 Tax=Candidatus Villigracilis proximus TaxID=3140683 RepID=UPI003135C5F3|nr:hypothetical protein [Anaerolineales bacterium]
MAPKIRLVAACIWGCGCCFVGHCWINLLAERAGLGEGSVWIILFVTLLSYVFDLAEGATAIWLSFLFGRGQWSRPWWGLILFALADGVDTFDWLGGYDLIPVWAQDTLNFIALIAYPLVIWLPVWLCFQIILFYVMAKIAGC